MIQTILQNVRKGSLFREVPNIDAKFYVRDHYDPSSKKYAYHLYDDFNSEFFSFGSKKVYVEDYEDLYIRRISYALDF